MTTERYNYIENQMEKISLCDRLTDAEITEEQFFLFENREEFEEWNDIRNGITKPTTKQDILEVIADEKYNKQKEES